MDAVLFRKDKYGVFAIFPYLSWRNGWTTTCYAHMGQHSFGDYDAMISQSKPAKASEYRDLLRELRRIGYRLRVIHRACRRKMYQL